MDPGPLRSLPRRPDHCFLDHWFPGRNRLAGPVLSKAALTIATPPKATLAVVRAVVDREGRRAVLKLPQ